jgi:hypothetical protein
MTKEENNTEKICLYLPGSMVRRLRRQSKTGGYNGNSDYIAAVLSDAWNIRRPVLRGPGRPKLPKKSACK